MPLTTRFFFVTALAANLMVPFVTPAENRHPEADKDSRPTSVVSCKRDDFSLEVLRLEKGVPLRMTVIRVAAKLLRGNTGIPACVDLGPTTNAQRSKKAVGAIPAAVYLP